MRAETEFVRGVVFLLMSLGVMSGTASAETSAAPEAEYCQPTFGERRNVCADIAAFDQLLVYNRFGSFNPYGMMFALKRDLTQADLVPAQEPTADYCASLDGTEIDLDKVSAARAGKVRLKDCKRPRPLVLRANVGDVLTIRVQNLLLPNQPDFSRNVCRLDKYHAKSAEFGKIHANLSVGEKAAVMHGEASCLDRRNSHDSMLETDKDFPATRGMNLAIQGLRAIGDSATAAPDPVCLGLAQIGTGESRICHYQIDDEGTFFISSKAAPSGGEGDGGSITHGLFGAVVAEQKGTQWFRSQVSRATFDKIWAPKNEILSIRRREGDHARKGNIDYNAKSAEGIPYLALAREIAPTTATHGGAVEIVHSDLNAIIYRAAKPNTDPKLEIKPVNFREFTVFFHDELKTFYTKNFEELGQFDQLAGARDGFAINYGASGMGAMVLANRKGVGPAANCIECLYEEFFLSSWANGDPALLENYADDPSNVHHSYLNDSVVFRNFHAGPKETHVFHLHAHQWFAGNDEDRGGYLDSQTVAPEQGFTYNIYHGGQKNDQQSGQQSKGWWQSLGAGNRNRSPGDSIFHCHLYPHFAQGMWELWRNHDVLEDGTRVLADGQKQPGLSVAFNKVPEMKRPGSVGRNGEWLGSGMAKGTPVPAIIPLPDMPLPLLPTYTSKEGEQIAQAGMPGYPYYIDGEAGHRAPQPPLDMAKAKDQGQVVELNGGLPRHVVSGGEREFAVSGIEPVVEAFKANDPDAGKLAIQYVAKVLALGDFTAHLKKAKLEIRPSDGTVLERAGMGFHYNGKRWADATPVGLDLKNAKGEATAFVTGEGGYATGRSPRPDGGATPDAAYFYVNGSKPKPGAPFADPCAIAEGLDTAKDDLFTKDFDPDGRFTFDRWMTNFRRYEASAVQLDLVTNRARWHDPQARINVLTRDSDKYKGKTRGYITKKDGTVDADADADADAGAEPFFFRALSGECVEFRHTNQLPKDLDLDDFQMRTPTDTIGQHIHLVKFDVTSSDGSANGWNYEDGTFAPDEVVARICASDNAELAEARGRFCAADGTPLRKDFWKVPLNAEDLQRRRELPFQTTVQRWFADPILSDTGKEDGSKVDRTMRTVFTHDHFGPSSIQQHGFYSALIIEPRDFTVCPAVSGSDGCTEAPDNIVDSNKPPMLLDDEKGRMVGARKILNRDNQVKDSNSAALHSNFREFALAIADFATLYDPKDWETVAELKARYNSGTLGDAEKVAGIETLYCEGKYRDRPDELEKRCGSGMVVETGLATRVFSGAPGNKPPAWVAGGMVGDRDGHRPPEIDGNKRDLLTNAEIEDLLAQLIVTRRHKDGDCNDDNCKLAKPVAPPKRPESISVDHHDPYLVNYRGEPMPLRVGGKQNGLVSGAPRVRSCIDEDAPSRCSAEVQHTDAKGDMANVFLSSVHGDPVTPLLEAYSGDRVVLRLIQGAQEVQHSFNIEGYSWRRNLDQTFPMAARPPDHAGPTTRHRECLENARKHGGKPLEYRRWFERSGPLDSPEWFKVYEEFLKNCDNIEGFGTAQEIGISEHFEFKGAFRQTHANGGLEFVDRNELIRRSTDYLYDFGSLDSLWNGAWGLIRIHANPGSADPTCKEGSSKCVAVGKRLPLVGENAIGAESPVAPSGTAIELPGSCPKVVNGDSVTQKWEAVAAVETRDIWPAAVDYGLAHYDPNALILVRIDAQKLFGKSDFGDDIWYGRLDEEGTRVADAIWTGVRRVDLIAHIRKGLGIVPKPVPYKLTVKAGECINLAVINLLSEAPGTEDPKGLRDANGDALMPKITPLNTDVSFHCDEEVKAAKVPGCELDVSIKNNGKRSRHELRPSARFALNVALPALTGTNSMALPFGYNELGALAPAGDILQASKLVGFAEDESEFAFKPSFAFMPRAESVELLRFYAGRSSVDDKYLYLDVLKEWVKTDAANKIRDWAALQTGDPSLTYLTNGSVVFEDKKCPIAVGNEQGAVPVSEGFCTVKLRGQGETKTLVDIMIAGPNPDPQGNDKAYHNRVLKTSWNAVQRNVINESRTHWVPYAFGALPIKSFGDVIGHGVHGLFGTLDVVPASWMPSNDALSTEQPLNDRYVVAASGNEPQATIREFTVFYRDGLGLRDKNSKIAWTVKGSGQAALDNDGTKFLGKPVPDCPICDDTYDFGEKGVNYQSPSFHSLLRASGGCMTGKDIKDAEMLTDLNACKFPDRFFTEARKHGAIVLKAVEDEEVVIRVLHPGGRARQRSFTTIGQDYDDLFPGFGFPHAALLAPGKSVTAALSAPVKPGCYLWLDGAAPLRAGGTWGLLDVHDKKTLSSACDR